MKKEDATYEWQLQFLSGIRMLDHELTKGLPNTMTATFLCHFIELIVRKIELVAGLIVYPHSFPGTHCIHHL